MGDKGFGRRRLSSLPPSQKVGKDGVLKGKDSIPPVRVGSRGKIKESGMRMKVPKDFARKLAEGEEVVIEDPVSVVVGREVKAPTDAALAAITSVWPELMRAETRKSSVPPSSEELEIPVLDESTDEIVLQPTRTIEIGEDTVDVRSEYGLKPGEGLPDVEGMLAAVRSSTLASLNHPSGPRSERLPTLVDASVAASLLLENPDHPERLDSDQKKVLQVAVERDLAAMEKLGPAGMRRWWESPDPVVRLWGQVQPGILRVLPIWRIKQDLMAVLGEMAAEEFLTFPPEADISPRQDFDRLISSTVAPPTLRRVDLYNRLIKEFGPEELDKRMQAVKKIK